MNATTGRLSQTVVGAVVGVGLCTGVALALVAPRLLLVDREMTQRTVNSGLAVGLGALLVSSVITAVRLRRYRYTLRALGLGSHSIEPEELIALDQAPAQLTLRATSVWVFSSLLTLIPPVRPEGVDPDTAVSLVLLAITFCATAALPLYVLIRGRIAQAMQLAPEETIREVMGRPEIAAQAEQRLVRRVLLAVLTPVALVGFGIALLAHAHVRAFEAQERLTTATALAQAALEPVPGAVPTAGELDAAAAATDHGFWVRLFPTSTTFHIERKTSGEMLLTVPLDQGHTTIAFDGTTVIALTTTAIVAAILASMLASVLGARVGLSLAQDLGQVTRQVQTLGTESVLRGAARVARPARYAVVAALGQAIERLAERFRVFASTQEKAIEAREAAQRMRGLLFASVSHDLKSCLNAILGFADLIQEDSLNEPQAESLHVIQYRGRELLGLIQTILDAARVEAGQLVLHKGPAKLDALVAEAVENALKMGGLDCVPVQNEITYAPWELVVDGPRVVDALSALIRHALRTTTVGVVRVRGAVAPSGREVLVDIEAPTKSIPASRLMRLLLPDGESTMPRSAGGLALGLSLARSLIVLHSGSVQAFDTTIGVVLRVLLPLAPQARPRGALVLTPLAPPVLPSKADSSD